MIQFLRGTQAALNSSPQIFAEGQPIYEKDTHQLKIGDGVNSYSGLPYVGGSTGSSYEVHFDPNNSSWNGYVDLNDNIRLVFGRLQATLNFVNTQIESRVVNTLSDGDLLGFPPTTSSCPAVNIQSMYGMKSRFLVLTVSGQAGDTLAMFHGGTYFSGDNKNNVDLAIGYFGETPAFNYEVYGTFLTWD